MNLRTLWLAFLPVLLTFALVACGGDDDDDADGGTPPATAGETSQATAGSPGADTPTAEATADGTASNSPDDPAPTTADGSTKVNACELAPQAEAETATTGPLDSGRSSSLADTENEGVDIAICLYQGAESQEVSLTLLVRTGPRDTVAAAYDVAYAEADGPVDVTDIGDSAFWWPTDGQINVLEGNNWFIMRPIPRVTDSEPPSALVELARSVASRLGE